MSSLGTLLQFLLYSYNRYRDETHMISICIIIYMHESHQLDQKFENREVPMSCNIHGTRDIRFLRGFSGVSRQVKVVHDALGLMVQCADKSKYCDGKSGC